MQSTIESFTSTSKARIDRLEGVPLAEARFLLPHALGQEGFTVLSEIDFADSLNRSLDERRSPYFVFVVSHPKLAEEALAVSAEGGLLQPSQICLWQEAHEVVIATLPASRVVEALGQPHLAGAARQIEDRLARVFQRMTQPGPTAFDVPPRTARKVSVPALDTEEVALLRDAAEQHCRVLLAEAAGTESHPLQHAIAQNISRLEAVCRKLGTPLPSA
jgi:uncharacterized protein (DUF302 family)